MFIFGAMSVLLKKRTFQESFDSVEDETSTAFSLPLVTGRTVGVRAFTILAYKLTNHCHIWMDTIVVLVFSASLRFDLLTKGFW